jgi:hypothetical protein
VFDNARPKDGIKELIPIDPLNIEKVREVKKSKAGGQNQIEVVEDVLEYYIYTPDNFGGGRFFQGQ